MPSFVSMVTKAKPRGRPDSRSVGMATSDTVPYCEKSSRISFSVALHARLPTYILLFIRFLTARTICCFFDCSRTSGFKSPPEPYDSPDDPPRLELTGILASALLNPSGQG